MALWPESVGWHEKKLRWVTLANFMAPRLGQLGPKGRMWQFWEHRIFVLNLFPSSIYRASSLQLKPSQAQAEVSLLSLAHVIQSPNSEYITQGLRVRQILGWRWREISSPALKLSCCWLEPKPRLLYQWVLFTGFKNTKEVILFVWVYFVFAFTGYIDRCQY